MFVGHFGIAELGKAARRQVPLLWFAMAAYLPDLTRIVLPLFTQEHELYSHSIPAVLVQGIVIGALWKLRRGTLVDSLALATVCFLHWPADVFTGCKPTTFDGPWIGLGSYRHPVSDLSLEGALLVLGWFLIRRREGRFSAWWVALGLALQVGFLASTYRGSEFYIGHREWTWRPDTTWRPLRHTYETWTCKPHAEE
jgi:hypothetical protein